MKNFGNKIKALRRKMNLTQEELAEKLNEYDKNILLVGDGADIAYKYLSEKCKNISIL